MSDKGRFLEVEPLVALCPLCPEKGPEHAIRSHYWIKHRAHINETHTRSRDDVVIRQGTCSSCVIRWERA